MKTFYIDSNKRCDLVIHDNFDSYPLNDLDYSSSVVLWTIASNLSADDPTIEYIITDSENTITVQDKQDGYYIINKVVIPKKLSSDRFVRRIDYIKDEQVKAFVEGLFKTDDNMLIKRDRNGKLSLVSIEDAMLNPLAPGERYVKVGDSITDEEIQQMMEYFLADNNMSNYIEEAQEIRRKLPETSFKIVYYDNGKFYKFISEEETEEITNEEVVSIAENDQSNLYFEQQRYFSICSLMNCYINICKEIFNNRISPKRCFDYKIDPQLTYKRDLIWSAINAIHYYVDSVEEDDNTYAQAENLLNTFLSCDMCGKYTKEDCGCKN